MSTSRPLPVFMPSLAGQNWSCHNCTQCCRTLVGHLTAAERRRIDEQNWQAELGVPPYVRLGRSWALNKHEDGRCVFLGDDGLCLIHARHGEAAKPLACRIYPFSVRPVRTGWRASLRFDCPSVQGSTGRALSSYRTWLTTLVGELAHGSPADDDVADWLPKQEATEAECAQLLRQVIRWLKRPEPCLQHRLIGAARLTEALEETPFARIRGPKLEQLVDRVLEALPAESVIPAEPATPRQRAMLRQLAFTHAEHVSHHELRSRLAGWGRQWTQLRAGRAFRVGKGRVPALPGVTGTATFEQVEAVSPASAEADAANDVVQRYLLARLEGRTVFGAGYYGWAVLPGLQALWLSVAAAGWLARLHAALHKRAELSLADVGAGLAIVDRAATRAPSLGTMAERLRGQYLTRDDGVARLLAAYTPSGLR